MKNYKLKIICLLCMFTAALSSCKKNELAEEKGLTGNHKNLAIAGDKKYDVLGYGYDVSGQLAEKESSRFPVIDIVKFVTQDPGSYLLKEGVVDYYDYTYGESAENYSKRLSQKYNFSPNVFGLFKGEINLSFAGKDSSSSKYIFSSARKIIEQRSLQISSTAQNLRDNYLTNKFKSDLVELPVALLIEKYGTHVLVDITLGARFDFNYESQTKNTKREEAAKAGLKFNGLLAITDFTADIEVNKVEANSNFNQTVFYRSIGGDGTKGLIGDITLDNSAPKLTIATWQSSCNRDNAVLIKIGKSGLVPLEDLISDPAKKAEVKSYIEQYLKEQGFRELGDVPVYVYYSSIGADHYFGLSNQPTIGDNGYFKNEGIAFYAFSKPTDGAVPVYVYYNLNSADHYYSLGNQPTTGNGNFRNEGIAFYAYPKNTPNTAPVYMYYSSRDSDHYMGTGNVPTFGNGTFVNEGPVFNVPL